MKVFEGRICKLSLACASFPPSPVGYGATGWSAARIAALAEAPKRAGNRPRRSGCIQSGEFFTALHNLADGLRQHTDVPVFDVGAFQSAGGIVAQTSKPAVRNEKDGRDIFHNVPDHFTGFAERMGMHAMLKMWRDELRCKTFALGGTSFQAGLYIPRSSSKNIRDAVEGFPARAWAQLNFIASAISNKHQNPNLKFQTNPNDRKG